MTLEISSQNLNHLEVHNRFIAAYRALFNYDRSISNTWITQVLNKKIGWLKKAINNEITILEEDVTNLEALLTNLKCEAIQLPSKTDSERKRLTTIELTAIATEIRALQEDFNLSLREICRQIDAPYHWTGQILNNSAATVEVAVLTRFWQLRNEIAESHTDVDETENKTPNTFNHNNFQQYIEFLLQNYPFLDHSQIDYYLQEPLGFCQKCYQGKATIVDFHKLTNLLGELYNDLQKITSPQTTIELILKFVEKQHRNKLEQILNNLMDSTTGLLQISKNETISIFSLYLYLKGKITTNGSTCYISFSLLANYLQGKLTETENPMAKVNIGIDPTEIFSIEGNQAHGGKRRSLDTVTGGLYPKIF